MKVLRARNNTIYAKDSEIIYFDMEECDINSYDELLIEHVHIKEIYDNSSALYNLTNNHNDKNSPNMRVDISAFLKRCKKY